MGACGNFWVSRHRAHVNNSCPFHMGTMWGTCVCIRVHLGLPTQDPCEFWVHFPHGYHEGCMWVYVGINMGPIWDLHRSAVQKFSLDYVPFRSICPHLFMWVPFIAHIQKKCLMWDSPGISWDPSQPILAHMGPVFSQIEMFAGLFICKKNFGSISIGFPTTTLQSY